ncbi:uncharacterized protein LOC121745150 isoform X3 [Salvia splendens]|nr:uncharacterized protein LOC121745150 isoform X3 [Salvia splendens]
MLHVLKRLSSEGSELALKCMRLKASVDSEICLRYYNRRDIPRALQAEHVAIYSEICMGVVQYWQLPEEIVPLNKMTEVGVQLTIEIESGVCTDHVDNLLDNSTVKTTEVENTGSCISTTSAADTTVSSLMNCVPEPVQCVNTSDKVAKPVQLGNTDYAKEQYGIIVNTNGPTSYSGLMGQPTDTNDLSQQSTSNVTEVVAHSTRNQSNYYSGPSSYVSQEAKISNSFLELNNMVDKLLYQNSCDGCSYMGSSFKTCGYINNYLHGDLAANLANYLRSQGRDVVSKRGCYCLLNAAASNANRKVLAGVRSMKKDGRLPGVATYIMFMEESLGVLLIGPFRSDTFRKRWRKEVEQATDCIAIKVVLLEVSIFIFVPIIRLLVLLNSSSCLAIRDIIAGTQG